MVHRRYITPSGSWRDHADIPFFGASSMMFSCAAGHDFPGLLRVAVGGEVRRQRTPEQRREHEQDELRQAVPAHLSLHGGTGASAEDLVASIRGGIVKVSYFHGMAEAALAEFRLRVEDTPHGMLTTLLDSIRPAFRDRALELLALLGGPGRPAALP